MVIEKDFYGRYEECVQCGYTMDLPMLQAVATVRVPHSTRGKRYIPKKILRNS